MKTGLITLVIVFGLLSLAGCVVYEDGYHHHGVYVHTGIEWAVWSYYDWDYDLVMHLHSYNYTPDEVSLILFLAFHSHIDPFFIVRLRQSGIGWMEITTVHLKLSPTVFFVDISPDVRLGPPYGRAYGFYRNQPEHIVLTDDEMISLVHLKVTSEAYGLKPMEVIKMREEGKNFDEIVRLQHDNNRELTTKQGRTIKDYPEDTGKTKVRPAGKTRPDKPSEPPKPDKDKPVKDKPGKGKKG